MAYKMKNGTGPNALPLLGLIPPAIVAGKALLGATGAVAGAKAGVAAGTAVAAAAKTAAGAIGAGAAKATAGTVGAVTGKAGLGGKIVAGAAKAVKGVKGAVKGVKSAVEATKAGKALIDTTTALGKKKVLGSTVKEHATSALKSKIMQAPAKAQQEIKERQALKQQEQSLFKSKFLPSMMGDKKGPNMEKSRKRVAQDYARNAIVDRKEGRTKDANYEQKQATRVAAGEAPSMMGHNPISKHMSGRGASMYGGPKTSNSKETYINTGKDSSDLYKFVGDTTGNIRYAKKEDGRYRMMFADKSGKKPYNPNKTQMMKGGENVIDRDAKSGGKDQYNKRGK